MIIKLLKVKRKNSNKYDKKILLKCDECGEVFDVFDSSFKKGQERHSGIHLCWSCANSSKYKRTPIKIGKDNDKFKGGISQGGYRRIYYNGKNQFEHRVVASQKLGRELVRGEEVHHIDGVKLNNRPDNLFVFESKRKHRRCHYFMETLALSLLGEMVWFDVELERYQTKKVKGYNPFRIYDKLNSIDLSFLIPQVTEKENKYICKKGTNRALHIFIIEELVGRKLFRDEVVHHIDGISTNNDIDNLYLTFRNKHKIMHESLNSCIYSLYKGGKVSFNFEDGCYFYEK